VNAIFQLSSKGTRLRLEEGATLCFANVLPDESCVRLSRTRRDQLLAIISLYKALGGGWKEANFNL
jgi:hypothetical protein